MVTTFANASGQYLVQMALSERLSEAGEVQMRLPRREPQTEGRAADDLAGRPGPPRLADRSCCCPARPVVRVLIPPVPARPHPVDLFLCRHHYMVSRAALAAIGAAVVDGTGTVLDPVSAGCRRSQG
jgi:hypothetical protein